MTSRRLLAVHFAAQLVFLGALWFIPTGGWLHAIWQTLAGLPCALFVVLGARRHRPQAVVGWYLIAGGLFLSACGTTVELIGWRCCNATTNPNVADLFWLSLHVSLIAGLALFVYRRARVEELGAGTINTIACALLNLFVGVFAWQYIVWRAENDTSLTLANRFIVTLYPLADLMVVALVLRLLLGGGFRNVSLLLIAAAMGWFLASDVGWSDYIRSHAFPHRWREFFVEASSIIARALLGAVTLLPSVGAIAPSTAGAPRLGPMGWVGLAASVLTAPVVLGMQALLDRFYSVSSL